MNNDYINRVKVKRQTKDAEKKRAALLASQKAAAKQNSENIVGAIAQQGARSRTTTQSVKVENDNLAKSDDFNGVIDSINKMNMTTFMSTRGFHDMAENIQRLSSELDDLKASIQQEGLTQITTSFDSITKRLESITKTLNSAQVKTDSAIIEAVNSLKDSINKLDIKPVVNVPTPTVTVDAPELDISPITEAIAGLKNTEPTKEKFNFSDYMAQDMDSESPGFQYIGLVKPDGGWAIMQNDTEGNSIRYVFGKRGYSRAWSSRVGLGYKLLNEAVNAVQA